MSGAYDGSHQEFGVVRESDVMVPMRDGVRLATDIYFPATGGRRADGGFQVILDRTPYEKRSPTNVANGKYFARRGYVCAVQDVRGRFKSEGEWYPFAKEALAVSRGSALTSGVRLVVHDGAADAADLSTYHKRMKEQIEDG